jgi:aryl-alcohol dehydrogenase-like predicted oxidoreductase
MEYRELGRTGWQVSAVSFGAWAIGGSAWGGADDDVSMRALHRALDLGVNCFDTADVYGDGHSERLLARLRRERSEPFLIATKAGRALAHAAGYNCATRSACRAQPSQPGHGYHRPAPAALPTHEVHTDGSVRRAR